MPLLPSQNIATTSIGDPGQGPSLARAGQVWDAVASVGGQMEKFGAELAYKRKQAETSSYVNTSANDFKRFMSEKETELQSQFTGDPTGYSAALKEQADSWHQERLDSAPNSDAKAAWEQHYVDSSTTAGLRASAWENTTKAKYQVGLIDDSVRKDQQHLAQKPDPTKAAEFITNTAKMVNDGKGIWYDGNEARLRLQKYGADTATALFQGLEAEKQYSTGLDIINGKHPNSKILLESMDPKDIANIKERFPKLQQAENEFSKSMFMQTAGDYSLALQEGKKVDPSVISGLQDKSKSLKPEERAVFLDNLNHDVQYNGVLQNIKTLPLEDAKKLLGTTPQYAEGDLFNYKGRTEKAERFKKMAAEIYDKRLNNAPQFYAENDRNIQNLSNMAKDVENPQGLNEYTKNIVAKQSVDKVGNPKVFSPDLSETYAKMIKSPNPEMAEKAYQAMRQGMQVGETNYARHAISDMVRLGHLTPDYAMALSLEDPQSRKSALANLGKSKEIDEQYTNFKKSNDIKESEFGVLDDSRVNAFKSAIQSISKDNNNVSTLNGFDSLLTLEYKTGRIAGKSEKEAKKAAIDKVLNKNFDIAKAGNSQLILGHDDINRKDEIKAFMTDSLEPVTLRDRFKVATDPAYHTAMGLLNKPEQADQRYLEDIKKNGEWVTNSSQSGATLFKRMANGGRALVKDKDGNPISVSYANMKGLPKRMDISTALKSNREF
jgi:hypothetical protein